MIEYFKQIIVNCTSERSEKLALLTCLPVGGFARGSVNLEEKKMFVGFAASSPSSAKSPSLKLRRPKGYGGLAYAAPASFAEVASATKAERATNLIQTRSMQ